MPTVFSRIGTIDQKGCLVALSTIVNTIEPSNRQYYTDFETIREGCLIKDFFTVTERQRLIFETLKGQLGSGKRQSLTRLKRFCSRRYDDLSEELEKGTLDEQDDDATEEELVIMGVMECLCNEIDTIPTPPNMSEVESVLLWRNVARILFQGEVVPRVGELGSQSTRGDRVKVEGAFGGATTNVKSRKIDISLRKQMPGNKSWEVCSWEAKSINIGAEDLQIQRRKNLRHNASIANTTSTMAGFTKSRTPHSFPHPSPVILDIEGLRALPYVVRKMEPGVFGAGIVTEEERMICFPQTKEDIEEFLDGGHMSALLSIKRHNHQFTEIVKKGVSRMGKEAALAKMLGNCVEAERSAIINTPTKAQPKRIQPRELPNRIQTKKKKL
ncbi:hypothetical protein B0O80DRAFT_499500 [Mortierella sp. GBAus27b]|nr:hypothetical protein BGX31_010645 [Mortierella sp. GBA43]KAI8352193.1 hypothetical protein B0O80DRAFT_499500 [Mortierella sp. GBAus27b]